MRMKILIALSLVSLLCAQSLPEMRMLPAEMRGGAVDGNQIGSSGLAGVHTKVLFGDPSKAGFYSILLFVPAHTTIRHIRTAMIAWRRWCQAPGISVMATVSRGNP